MDNDRERPDQNPDKKKPDEMPDERVKDVPEIKEHELPDELHKETNPSPGTERIQDSTTGSIYM